MKKQCLAHEPTPFELKKVGFEKTEEGDFVFVIKSPHGLFLKYTFEEYIARAYLCGNGQEVFIGSDKIDINKTLELFGLLPFDWGPGISPGEVWTDSFEDVQVLELDKVYVKVQVLDLTVPCELFLYQTYKLTIDKFLKGHRIIFNSLEEYYSEKFQMKA
jgi:hypothetical protein